jgi:hypothetical protein
MIFTIKKGCHNSNGFLHKALNFINRKRVLNFRVYFHSSCEYDLGTIDQFDINKLHGFSLGFNHHQDSARFGWRSAGNKIELFAYCYVSGNRMVEKICSITTDEFYELKLRDTGTGYYEFSVYNQFETILNTMYVSKQTGFKTGMKLWPYFGGNRTAPHDMQIQINQINETKIFSSIYI